MMRDGGQHVEGGAIERSRRWLLGMGGMVLAGAVVGRAARANAEVTPEPSASASPVASPVAAIPDASAFMLLRNTGEAPDRLIGATTDVAGSVIRRTFDDTSGVRRQVLGPVGVDLPAGRTIALAPGGAQLLLREVRQALPPNSWYALTLVFAVAGSIVVPVNVRWGGAPIVTNINRANRYTSGDMTVIEPWAFPVGQAAVRTPIPATSEASPATE